MRAKEVHVNRAFPDGISIEQGCTRFEGVDLAELAAQWGTPLYVMSERIVRDRCAQVRQRFIEWYPGSRAYYASKAFQSLELLRIVKEEGLGVDVVSGGELFAALKAGIEPEQIVFHGNAKTDEELAYAVDSGTGRIAVDNLDEIYRIEQHARRANRSQAIWFRVTPGVDSHTHRFISTGSLDSKFGIPLEPSETPRYVKALQDCPHVQWKGLHFHIGSQLMDNRSHLAALSIVLDFALRLAKEYGLVMRELNMGGGFGITCLPQEPAPGLDHFIEPMMAMVQDWSRQYDMPMPACAIEPGRWIVGEAGLTIYRVIAVKEIPGIRTYVAVDGGMGDNIRPALYGARYHAALVSQAGSLQNARPLRRVTIAGRYCESGDILVQDIELPEPHPGDLVVLFSTGAYCMAMSSTYNRVPRPALVMVNEGTARLSIRRERWEELISREL